MGQLFSRAFKRITQGGQSRSPSNQSQQRVEQQDLRDKPDNDQRGSGGPSEAIAVGQSIDSDEYAALETNNNTNTNNNNDNSREEEDNKENSAAASRDTTAAAAAAPAANGTSDKDKQDVEEAVIKIQALVRGHLTRKALKDAHQQSVPANALGRSQFDADSLIRNPPSAVFSSSSPLNLAGDREPQAGENNNQARTPLASIAEVTENAGSRLEAGTDSNNGAPASSQTSASGRKKLAALSVRKTPSPSTLEVGGDSGASRGSSPTPSHASIDLGHDGPTCFSASIDILDHNLKPTDKFAAVLHHREEPPKNVSTPQPPGSLPTAAKQAPPTISTPDDDGRGRGRADDETGETRMTMPAGTPDSLGSVESEEAAAVRIQSAFRGYRTRKNSPYRTRSPNNNNPGSPVLGAAPASPLLEPATASDLDKRVSDTNMAASDGQEGAEGQRTSRPRHRDEDGADELVAIEEQLSVNQGDEEVTLTGTTDASVGTVRQLTLPHPLKAVESTATEAAAADVAVAQQSQEGSTASLSFDIGQSEANTLDTSDGPMGGLSSAALETGPQTYSSLDVGGRSIVGIGGAATSPASLAAPKQAIGGGGGGGATKESRASIDTDSSILGAALSLNEADISVAEQSSIVQPATQRASVPTVPMLEEIDEDKSLGVSVASEQLELEARKLVDELTGDSRDRRGQSNDNDECALEEATNELEEALEEATAEEGAGAETEPTSLLLSSAIGNDEQAQLELDSDEIERRDPRGDNLAVEALDEALGGSGGSSLGGSSSSDEDDNKAQQQQRQQQHQQQQQQQQQQQAGANKNKKKNRNKKKGKK